MNLPKLELKKLNVFAIAGKAVDATAKGISATVETAQHAKGIWDKIVDLHSFVMNYNSPVDDVFESQNPIPGPDQPLVKRIPYFCKRAITLIMELLKAISEHLKEQEVKGAE